MAGQSYVPDRHFAQKNKDGEEHDFFDVHNLKSGIGTAGDEGGNSFTQENVDQFEKDLPFHYVDSSDAYANQHDATISIENVSNHKRTFFKAFITAFNETYSCDWASETVFGRADPIYMFKQTKRSITLAFQVPAATKGEAFENLARMQSLIQNLYPQYRRSSNASTIAQSPLVRIEVLNLTPRRKAGSIGLKSIGQPFQQQSRTYQGVLAVINNCTINHNIESTAGGVFQNGIGVFYPKYMDVSLDLSVIHEAPLGWTGDKFSDRHFPYGINYTTSVNKQGGERMARDYAPRRQKFDDLSKSGYGEYPMDPRTDFPILEDEYSQNRRAAAAEAEREQHRANAEAKYGNIFSGLIYKAKKAKATRLGDKYDEQRKDYGEAAYDLFSLTYQQPYNMSSDDWMSARQEAREEASRAHRAAKRTLERKQEADQYVQGYEDFIE